MHIKTETKVGLFVLVALAILAYMLIHLGVFRLHVKKYQPYEVHFEDVSGLTEKSDVKIAGVKVGWIEKIALVQNMHAQVHLMIKGRYQLHHDAYALIRQEGLLGAKYIEIMTGSPERPILSPGALLPRPGEISASMETLMTQFKQIADNVKDVSSSLCCSFAEGQQQEKMQLLVNNLSEASKHIASVSAALDRSINSNEVHINSIVQDITIIAADLKQAVPEIKGNVDRLSNRLDNEILPAFQQSIEKIANVFDRDFGTVSKKLSQTVNTIEQTINEARDGIGSLKSISTKLDHGDGLLGKLINDDTVYQDIKSVTSSIRTSVKKMDDLHIEVNAHGEAAMQPSDGYCYRNNKGYFDMRFYMSPQWFYKLQIVNSERGWPDRMYRHDTYLNKNCQVMNPDDIIIDEGNMKVAPNVDSVCMRRNATRLDLQFGKVFDSGIALRAGSFENTFGVALDYRFPITSDVFQWIMSLEAYDFYGRNRLLCDRRPHLKWINSLYLFKNLYLTVGADDFISRYNKNGFWGGGLCFSDDDLKHVASKIGVFGTH